MNRVHTVGIVAALALTAGCNTDQEFVSDPPTLTVTVTAPASPAAKSGGAPVRSAPSASAVPTQSTPPR